ncbi:MAG: Xaa-Pro peptidase family protein, partial [Gaiellaceae bacterium]
LQEAMAVQDVDACVLRLAENVLLVTGWYVQIPGLGFAVVPREGAASLLVPEYEAAEAATVWGGDVRTYPAIRNDGLATGDVIVELLSGLAQQYGASGGAIGFEGSFETLAPASLAGEPNAVGLPTQSLIRSTFSTERLVDVTETLESIRAVKSAHELEKLRTVNEIAAIGLNAFKEHAIAGRSEVEIMAAVEGAICSRGHGHNDARVVRGYATVYSGPDLALGWQYFRSRTRVVEQNDVVMLELGTVADGFWSDHTRTVVVGGASPRQREAYETVRAAARAAFATAIPGATGGEVDAAARATCAAAGFTQFPHHTGHGVGFRYHESRPQLVPGGSHLLAENMVIVTEPGIYENDLQGGFRYEDNAVVTATGAVELVTTDYDLD